MLRQIKSRSVEISDLSTISSIVLACAARLKEKNLNDWSWYYTEERLAENIKTKDGYLFLAEEVPVGVLFLSTKDVYYYSPADMEKFKEPKVAAFYISTLAVSPEYQHQGIATKMINFGENLAREKEIKYLRLDCNSNDELLLEFYKKRGFEVVSRMEKEPEYVLLEKRV